MNIEEIRIESLIGRGAMGSVYKGFQPAFCRVVAIKIPHSHLYFKPATLQRFKREAMHTAALKHPNIVRVYQFVNTSEDVPALVMEFVEGRTLAELLKEAGPFPESRVIPIFTQILDALAHAHAHGIMHRDLKPANVMILPSGAVKLMDLGLAKSLNADQNGQSVTDTGDLVGTPLYMSPEQAEGREYDERCDIYAVGCMLFEVMEGAPPFSADTAIELLMKHMESTTPSAVHASPALASIINRALSKDPQTRFTSAAEMKSALEAAADNPSLTLYSADGSRSSRSTKRRPPTKSLIGFAMVAIAIMIPLLAFSTGIAPHTVPDAADGETMRQPRLQGAQALMESVQALRSGWDTHSYETPQAKRADFDHAERVLRQAVEASSAPSANPRDKVSALSELGDWIGKDSDPKRQEESRVLLKQAAALYPNCEDAHLAFLKSGAMLRLGWNYHKNNQLEEAESWLLRAKRECERPVEPAAMKTCSSRVNALNNLADFYDKTGHPEKAVEYERIAFDIYEARGQEFERGGLEETQLLGMYLFKAHLNKEAGELLQKAARGAREEAQAQPDQERVSRLWGILDLLRQVYEAQGQAVKAQVIRQYADSIRDGQDLKEGDPAERIIRAMKL